MDVLLAVLKILAAIATIATGLVSLIKPKSVYSFTGLRAEGGRGITEIRAILGAFFIALGAVALFYRMPETNMMLGVTYLFVGLVRFVSMFLDDSVMRSNVISVIVELVLGIILVIPG
jgi:hypothetical protein